MRKIHPLDFCRISLIFLCSLSFSQTEKDQGYRFIKRTDNRIIIRFTERDSIVMIPDPAGTFRLGTDKKNLDRIILDTNTPEYQNEAPEHLVKIISPFWISEAEISTGVYHQFGLALTAQQDIFADPANYNVPVTDIDWFDACNFCNWLSGLFPDYDFRLPHEVEWEYAAKANSQFQYPWQSNYISDSLANYNRTLNRLVCVNSYMNVKNPYGLLNLAGNAAEWCYNTEFAYKKDNMNLKIDQDPGDSTSDRAVRGGSFLSSKWECRSTARYFIAPNSKKKHVGFKIVMFKTD